MKAKIFVRSKYFNSSILYHFVSIVLLCSDQVFKIDSVSYFENFDIETDLITFKNIPIIII